MPSPRTSEDSGAMGYLPGSPEYRRVMTAMFAAGLATFVLMYDTQALLPDLSREFAVSPGAATLTVSLTTVALAVTLLGVGPLSEARGRTPVMVWSVWSAAAIALLCPFAQSWSALLTLRLAQGVALAGVPAVATAYLREEVHPSVQARAAGLYIGGTALGGMAGRLLTAPVTDLLDWRWGMGAAAAFGVVCAVVVTVTLPASRHFQPRRRDLLAMSRAALSDPGLRWLYLVGGAGMGTLVATYNALGYRLTDAPFRLNLTAAGLLYLTYLLGSVSSTVAGLAADRLGRRAVLPAGALIALAGVAITLADWLPAIVVGLSALTVGFFAMHGLASGWVPVRAHAVGASASQCAAFYLCAYYLGSSVFGTLGGIVWSAVGWPGVAVMGLVLIALTLGAAVRLRGIPHSSGE